jgi:hypothetical protein
MVAAVERTVSELGGIDIDAPRKDLRTGLNKEFHGIR